MIEKLEEIKNKFGERTAYICGGEQKNFAEVFSAAEKIRDGFTKGDTSPAVVFGGRSSGMLSAIIACILSGRAYVPIDTALPEKRRKKAEEISKAGTIIDCRGAEPRVHNFSPEYLPAKTAYIIFTSGSTGEPKGVPVSYENLENFIGWITRLSPLCGYEHCAVLNHASYSFDLSTAAVFFSLFGGHELIQCESGKEVLEIFDIIRKNKTDIIFATPTFIRLCLIDKSFCADEFPFLRCIYFCGEALQKSLVKEIFARFPGIRIINAYGPTEATSAVCASEITKGMLTEYEILPAGDVETAAAEIVIENGEIILKGKSVFSGYCGNLPGGNYSENGKNCYRTGDLGFIREGKLFCTGRADGQIKYKGFRIELSDIESNLSEIEGVENCAVIAKRNPEGEVRLLRAFYSGKIEEEKVRKALSGILPEYMVPKVIKKLEALPVSKNGKIDRKELGKL